MDQSNSLMQAASLVQGGWWGKQPLSLCWTAFPSFSIVLFDSLVNQFFCPSCGQTNESSRRECKSWRCFSDTHIRRAKLWAFQSVWTFGSWVRSVCNNVSRIRLSWWSCDICEHCVPVNAVTHYPLSLPSTGWLASLLHSPSLPLCHVVFVIFFTFAPLVLFFFFHFDICNIQRLHWFSYKWLQRH